MFLREGIVANAGNGVTTKSARDNEGGGARAACAAVDSGGASRDGIFESIGG